MTSRTPAIRLADRVLAANALALLLLTALPGIAAAHTGEDVSLTHVIVEVARWSIGVAAVLALVVVLLWLRVRLRGRSQ